MLLIVFRRTSKAPAVRGPTTALSRSFGYQVVISGLATIRPEPSFSLRSASVSVKHSSYGRKWLKRDCPALDCVPPHLSPR
jgi:hypothetical protein